MKAISITQTQNMIIELIKQPLSKKIEMAGTKIHDSLINGAIHSASEVIRELSSWFEDLVWKVYLTSLFQCTIVLSWIRKLAAKKGMRLISYQTIGVTLSTGTKIQIRSPFFIKTAPKRGRKKRGPQKRGAHLLLSVMGFVNKVDPALAFRAIQLAVLSPSFEMASKTIKQEGIKLSANQIRRLVSEVGSPNLYSRVNRLLSDEEDFSFKNRRILLAVDGGRLRQRKNKRGPWPRGYKRCGFHTDWIEPKLFTLYVIDEQGNIVKDIAPFVDGTTGKLKEFMALLEQYLIRLGIEKASEVVLVGDGAPWIWDRIPKLIHSTGGDELKLTEIIDWTHAKQNLNKAFEMLSKKKREKVNFNYFKNLLFSGKINKIITEVKSLLNVRASNKIMKKFKSYFVSNSTRMQYEESRSMKLPIGSGVIESAIRRVVNMRVKSPGSFWKLDFVETVIYLRAQVLYGRWDNIIKNWAHSFRNDFMAIATEAAI
ncbi:MAG: hypothetical protein GY710_13795 [Desulfobacteraceae bacterium]|nr:hypothetical protein [Desulfobacteraceae bacterium]